jgi:hypothetical protein
MKTRLIIAAVVGVISCVMGFVSESRTGDTLATIKSVEKQLNAAFERKPIKTPPGSKYTNIVQVAPGWPEIIEIGKPLSWWNESIFKAKALIKYDESGGLSSPPAGVYSFELNDRYKDSEEPWHIQEDFDYYAAKAKMTILGGVGGAVAAVIILWFLSWGWTFLLARISELAAAIRGKQ